MSLSRRKVLMVGGAAAVVTAAGGFGMLATPSMSRAAAPWGAAGNGFDDPRLNALSYAILAPNPHNRQPWLFELVGEDRIDVRVDLDKRLPSTDPFDRQITIGFGCMLELLTIAAERQGYAPQIDVFPDGEGQPRLGNGRVASVEFVPVKPTANPLFDQILARRSNKEPFEARAVASAELEALRGSMAGGARFNATSDPTEVMALSENAWAAWMVEYETDITRRESIELMRIGNDAAVAQPDGIDLSGVFMSGAHAAGVITKEALDTPGTMAYDSGIDIYRGLVDATPAWGWLVTPENTRTDQLRAGAAWVRLNLAAQARGLAVHPWSQALQEFPEMADLYRDLHAKLAPGGGTVQMFARMGYGPQVGASPRWPLEAKLMEPKLVDA